MKNKEVKKMEKLMRDLVDAARDTWAISDALTLWLMSRTFSKKEAQRMVHHLLSDTNKKCRNDHNKLFEMIDKLEEPTETEMINVLKELARKEENETLN